ncbi:MAG: peptide-methionine (R)-S-oxide reductase MsrB [Cyclobacteriaceae bacterium]|nr:peptide-methionine (R)-S-oxide reductase MsrB [Cyclobacteriaceae bacterium]MCH8517771.1 peptide-methionine (R)-S-oxide reductase MsrB [Cyclobacteriaceae bacterium]
MKIQLLYTLVAAILFLQLPACAQEKQEKKTNSYENLKPQKMKDMTDAEWRERLSPEEYRVLRQQGTERPGTSEYDQHWEAGVYLCKGCGTELFEATTKFDAHCGWPSFYDAVDKKNIKEELDLSHGMRRIEVKCANCDGHLGHVFPDGPKPTGLRYCINGVALNFKAKE